MKKGNMYQGKRLTAGMLRNSETMKNMIYNEHAYKFLQTVRGTPAYWGKMLYENLAMLKAKGVPTFFMTFSAADYHWPEIIQTVAKQYGQDFSADQVNNMNWAEKSKWLRTNPVTAVRAFLHRFECMHEFIKGPSHPIGIITDFVTKVEFQARGSPHIHAEYWVKGAPQLDQNSDQEVCSFVDSYIKADIPSEHGDQELHQLVTSRQSHACSSYCLRGKGTCRFGFEKAPSEKTLIARSLPEESPNRNLKIKEAKSFLEQVQKKMKMDEAQGKTLRDILQEMDSSENEYEKHLLIAHRSSRIILKREVKASRINAYNPDLLRMWQANMDIQFIEDPVSAVMYVCSYMMKSEKGMGELLKGVCKEVANDDIQAQLKSIGRAFLGSREVSAQEAAMRVLSWPLMEKSRKVIFVNSGPKEARVALPRFDLEDLPDGEEDIFAKSIHDRYAARPDSLENMTLATFASSYSVKYSTSEPLTEEGDNHENRLQQDEASVDEVLGDIQAMSSNGVIQLKNQMGQMVRRRHEAVLRLRNINKEKDPNGYFYARLLLFFPWRDEDTLSINPKDLYCQHQAAIEENAKKFNQHSEEIDFAAQRLEAEGVPEHVWDLLAPHAQQENAEANEDGPAMLRDFDQEPEDAEDVSSVDTMNSVLGKLYTREAQKQIVSTRQYRKMYQVLNEEQKKIVNFNRDWCKKAVCNLKKGEDVPPYFIFLCGPGGTGKSHVVKLIQRDIHHFFNKDIHTNSDDPLVLLTAFTGTASFNIDGITLHSALCLPTRNTQGITDEKRSILQSRLKTLRLLIIDEISMVSQQMLDLVHSRLCLSKRQDSSSCLFANTSVLVMGDPYQIRPVGGSSLFARRVARDVQDLSPALFGEFQYHELTQIMRQNGDQQFANVLQEIRTACPGENSEADLVLKSREIVVPEDHPTYPKNVLHVFARNKHAATRNEKMLEATPGELCTIIAIDSTKDKNTNLFQVKVPDDPQKTGRLMKMLKLKVGTRVMLTQNIDVTDGLTNGAMGTVKQIIMKEGDAKCILVVFDHPKVGEQAKKKSQFKHICKESVPVSKVLTTFFIHGQKSAEVQRIQFPLTLSFAVTIHKVQGLTMDSIVVDMAKEKGGFDYGQAYVAFSRVKTLNGLHIMNYCRGQIKVDKKLHSVMEEFRRKQIHTQELSSQRGRNELIITHLNIQGLQAHHEDLEKDGLLTRSDVLCLTETHLKQSSLWPLSNISQSHHILRHEREGTDGGGIAIAIHHSLEVQSVMCSKSQSCEFIMAALKTGVDTVLNIICCYKAPKEKTSAFTTELKSKLSQLPPEACKIVLGDFNENIFSENCHIQASLAADNFQQQVDQPTTDYGSLLDHIYTSNVAVKASGVWDCYYSDHDATFIKIR